ncbi:MAG: hypothetical protein J6W75_10395 [Bacteroidaceae bacterium]|nr:hypothetical protein [Bacteroidaceae bacterium]
MARPIKPTPILTGKDAERFIEYISTPHPEPREVIERARQSYELAKRNSPNCDFFL